MYDRILNLTIKFHGFKILAKITKNLIPVSRHLHIQIRSFSLMIKFEI